MLGNQTKVKKVLVQKSNRKISKYQKDYILPILIKELKQNHKGKENAITSCELREFLGEMGYECCDSQIRSMIKYVQANAICKFVVSSHCGFFYTRKVSDVLDMIENFKKREDELKDIRKNLLAQLSVKK